MKSTLTLNRSLFRTAQQVSDFARRRNETLVEYQQGYLYCYPLADLSDIFAHAPDGSDIVAVYNCTDVHIWRKPSATKSSRSRYAA